MRRFLSILMMVILVGGAAGVTFGLFVAPYLTTQSLIAQYRKKYKELQTATPPPSQTKPVSDNASRASYRAREGHILEQILQLMVKTDNRVGLIRKSSKEKSEGDKTVKLTVAAEGSHSNLLRWLLAVDRMNDWISVDGLSLKTPEAKEPGDTPDPRFPLRLSVDMGINLAIWDDQVGKELLQGKALEGVGQKSEQLKQLFMAQVKALGEAPPMVAQKPERPTKVAQAPPPSPNPEHPVSAPQKPPVRPPVVHKQPATPPPTAQRPPKHVTLTPPVYQPRPRYDAPPTYQAPPRRPPSLAPPSVPRWRVKAIIKEDGEDAAALIDNGQRGVWVRPGEEGPGKMEVVHIRGKSVTIREDGITKDLRFKKSGVPGQ